MQSFHVPRYLQPWLCLCSFLRILISQQSTQDLPTRTLCDEVNKLHAASKVLIWCFVIGHPAEKRFSKLGTRHCRKCRGLDHERFRNLDRSIVRYLDDCTVSHHWMFQQVGLELCGCYLMALRYALVTAGRCFALACLLAMTLISPLILSTMTSCSLPELILLMSPTSPVRIHLPSS